MGATIAPARRVYAPRGAAAQVFETRNPEVLISGPAGTGKSRGILEKLHHVCLMRPRARALIVRKTAASLGSTALTTYKQWVAAEAIADGTVRYHGGSNDSPPQYRYSNGSVINIGGMDKPSKIMSSEYDIAYAQEATELTVTDWEMLNSRLRNGVVPYQQLLADCNPDRPTHWLKQRCDEGRTHMLYGRHEDNPRYYSADGVVTAEGVEYIARLDNLTGVRKARLRFGQWVGAEGIIYGEYDESVNLVDKPKNPPDEWPRYWTVDFGYTHPFVLQCWAVDPDGRAYRYREIFHTGRTVADHVATILKCVTRLDGSWKEPKPRAVICDHDAEDRATFTRESGLPTIPARKTVSDGIQATKQRWVAAGDGRPRLFYIRDALVEVDPQLHEAGRPTCSEQEIGGYVWNEAKDAPVKDMDDGMDATRYLVAHLDLQSNVRVRWL